MRRCGSRELSSIAGRWSFRLRRNGNSFNHWRRSSNRLGNLGRAFCNNRSWCFSWRGGCWNFMMCDQRRGRSNRRLYHHRNRGRLHGNGRARRGSSACGSLGHHRFSGRSCGDGGRNWRMNNNRRRRARLGNNLARLRPCRGLGSNNSCHHGRRYRLRRLRRSWRLCRTPYGQTALPRFSFLFGLFGLDSLQYVAGLGDMREINLGGNCLRGARTRCACLAGKPRPMLKMRADLVGLIILQRTGVGLAGAQAELCQYIKNLPALDFHLAREIVDTNLTHPPLFKYWFPKPLVAHSYLMALAVLKKL